MKYSYRKPNRRFFGPIHFGHSILLRIRIDRKDELKEFLQEQFPDGMYRWNWQYGESLNRVGAQYTVATHVRFAAKEDAFVLKMGWSECAPYPPVLW